MIEQDKLRIVVVDDSPDVGEAMTRLLNECGFAAKNTGDAKEALGLIQRWLPECVILDVDMPDIDGVELARHLRANYGKTMMLIALSGWEAAHPRVKEIAGIVDANLRKPCDLDRLIELLEPLRTPGPR